MRESLSQLLECSLFVFLVTPEIPRSYILSPVRDRCFVLDLSPVLILASIIWRHVYQIYSWIRDSGRGRIPWTELIFGILPHFSVDARYKRIHPLSVCRYVPHVHTDIKSLRLLFHKAFLTLCGSTAAHSELSQFCVCSTVHSKFLTYCSPPCYASTVNI